jgi:hypothetical protein
MRAFSDKRRVKVIPWPPQSPDLTAFGNLWKQIKGRVSKREHRAKNVPQMEQALRELWPQIKKESLSSRVGFKS